jgi:hypothetical protein
VENSVNNWNDYFCEMTSIVEMTSDATVIYESNLKLSAELPGKLV